MGFVSALVRRDGRQDVPQPRESTRKPGGGPSLRAGLWAPTPGLQSGEEKTPVLDTAPCEAVCRGGPNSASASAVEVIRFLLTGLVSLWRSPRAGRQGSVIVFHKYLLSLLEYFESCSEENQVFILDRRVRFTGETDQTPLG